MSEVYVQSILFSDDLFGAPDNNEAQLANGGDYGLENGETEERMDPSQAYAAIAAVDARLDQLRTEPEKIRQWREENAKLLAEKGHGWFGLFLWFIYLVKCETFDMPAQIEVSLLHKKV